MLSCKLFLVNSLKAPAKPRQCPKQRIKQSKSKESTVDELLKTVNVQICSKVNFCPILFKHLKHRTNKISLGQHYHTDTIRTSQTHLKRFYSVYSRKSFDERCETITLLMVKSDLIYQTISLNLIWSIRSIN